MKGLEATLKNLEKRKELLLARQKELSPEEDSSVSPAFTQEIEIPSAPKDSPALVRILFASEKEKSQILEAKSQELARLNSVLANKKEQLATQQPEMHESEIVEVKGYHHFIPVSSNPRSRVSDSDIKNYEDRIKQAQKNLSLLTAFANIPQHWPLA